MNTSKSESTRSKVDISTDQTRPKTAQQKNIREIYLESVNRHRGSKKGGKVKTKNISNIAQTQNPQTSTSSSSYLENEYTLVRKILTATKALEKLKTNNNNAAGGDTKLDGPSVAAHRANVSAFKYKTQEEYYQETMELKKTQKHLQNNEVIMKAKLEYYDNELNKKEQEILSLLDFKKEEGATARSLNEKDSLETINLRIKAYKLEFNLKRKDTELTKLKNDLKVTNMKELKLQNERLRAELSKALMSDQKILEAQELKGMYVQDGQVFYDLEKNPGSDGRVEASKTDIIKHNIAKRLQKSEAYENSDKILSKFGDFKNKITLRGGIKEQLVQLDQRETDCLEEIARLNSLKTNSTKSPTRTNSRMGSRESLYDKNKVNAVKVLQSVMKGHLERSRSLNKNDKTSNKKHSRSHSHSRSISPESRYRNNRDDSPSSQRSRFMDEDRSYRSDRPSSKMSNSRMSNSRISNSNRSLRQNEKRFSSEDEDLRSNGRPGSRNGRFDDEDQESVRSRRELIQNRNVAEAKDGVCCSPWRSFV